MKIHLIWLGGDPNRRTFACIESVLRAHRGHDVHLWVDGTESKPLLSGLQATHANLIIRSAVDVDAQAREVFGLVYSHFDRGHQFPYSVFTLRSDMYRLLILLNEGGLYLDTDIYCLKDTTTLICSENLYIGEEVHDGSAMGTNGVLGARSPGNPLLKEMIELGKRRENINDWGFLGPKLVTEFFNAHCNSGGVSLIKSDLLFPVCRYNIHRKLERHPARTTLDYEVSDEVFGVHIYDQIYSWTKHAESDFKVTVLSPHDRVSRRPVLRPRLHLIGSPMISSSAALERDDTAERARGFARMMTDVGYEVFHYGVEGAVTAATKEIELVSRKEWEASPNDSGRVALFNQRLVDTLGKNLACQRDIICLPQGKVYQDAVTRLHLPNPFIEIGVRCPSDETFAHFKIFNSYATYNQFIGSGRGADRYWVIPEPFDLQEWNAEIKKGGYLLFCGDYSEPNGGEVIDFIARARPDLKVLACGRIGSGMAGDRPSNVEFVTPGAFSSKSDLFGGALATISPTRTLGHFETAAVQSMLTGTPVLGSDFGSLPEIVVPGLTGFLCHNLEHYLDGIRRIEQGQLSRAEVAQYARAKYDMKVLARAYDLALQAVHEAGDYNWDGTWRP